MQELKKRTISNFIFVLQQQKKKLQYVERKSGSNKLINHHKCEAAFKAVAHALKTAVTPLEAGKTLSTKGVL